MLLRDLAEAGAAVLLYTSELKEVQLVCDRAIVIFGGRVVAEIAVGGRRRGRRCCAPPTTSSRTPPMPEEVAAEAVAARPPRSRTAERRRREPTRPAGGDR